MLAPLQGALAGCCCQSGVCALVCADRSGMVASRCLAAAVASVILLCFASGSRESHCNGFMQVANCALAADFFILALMIFLFKISLKKCFRIVVFPLWRRELQNRRNLCSCCA